MAVLIREDGTRPISLPTSALIGRSLRAEVQLLDPSASSVHASMRWSGSSWELRDHSSRNGTRVDGRDLEPGKPCLVHRSCIIEFGTPRERWTLYDDGPPNPFALAQDGTLVVGSESVLALPSQDSPEVTVFQLADQSWVLEDGCELRTLDEQAHVVAADTHWTIYLPRPADGTIDVNPVRSRPLVSQIHLRFRVSRNEERVEIHVEYAGRSIPLAVRAHGYMLLTLARQRLRDAKRLAEADQGWLHRDELARMLAMEPSHLYVAILRARKQFAEARVADAIRIIERRASCELRIGCPNLIVERV